jgi:hypothetical protein
MGEPSVKTIKRLYALSGNRCAFPGCTHRLVDESDALVADVCHIAGDKPGAKRYDPSQTEVERQGFANLIVLCAVHHRVIDDNETEYTRALLLEMKRAHEAKATKEFIISGGTARRIILAMAAGAAGGVAMSAAGELGRELGQMWRLFSDALDMPKAKAKTAAPARERQPELPGMPVEELRQILQYGPKGAMMYFPGNEAQHRLGEFFATLLRNSGWQAGLAPEERLPHPPDNVERLAMLFLMRDPSVIANAGRTIDELFRRCGFAPLSREDMAHVVRRKDVVLSYAIFASAR